MRGLSLESIGLAVSIYPKTIELGEFMTLLQPGIEIISTQNDSSGTLGMILTRGDDKLFLLTALHIIGDGETDTDIKVDGRVVARYKTGRSYCSTRLDAVAIEIIKDKSIKVSNCIKGTNKIIRDWGIEVAKKNPPTVLYAVGAVSQTTECKLEQYFDFYSGIAHVALLSNSLNPNYCAPGDSGSIWCARDGYAVSMHSKGNLPENKAISVRIKNILNEFKLSIYKYPSSLEK